MNISPPNPPPGWKAEWSPQYARYFYINLITNESTWILPATPPPPVQRQQSVQRKPVPTHSSHLQDQPSGASKQTSYVEGYPTPPPQVTTGYFPQTPSPQQLQQAQSTPNPAPFPHHNYQQQCTPFTTQQQPQYAHAPGNAPQPHFMVSQQGQFPHPSPMSVQQQRPQQAQQPLPQPQPVFQAPQQYTQQQQSSYITPVTTPSTAASQPPQQGMQALSPPLTPHAQVSQQPGGCLPSSYQQPQNLIQAANRESQPVTPQQQGYISNHPQQSNTIPHTQQANAFAPPTPPYQQQTGHLPQAQIQSQPYQQAKRSSMMGGNMMNKMSSKFTQFQKGVTGPATAGQLNGKPTDWKKWGKRAAIGVAGIGALALGADAAGDMFSGAEGLSGGDWSGGGGDFTGFEGSGDATGVMDAQTAVDANFAQHAMEGMGQDNAQMLADPVGTQYELVNQAAVNQASLALI